jgi:hypothetical protein
MQRVVVVVANNEEEMEEAGSSEFVRTLSWKLWPQ